MTENKRFSSDGWVIFDGGQRLGMIQASKLLNELYEDNKQYKILVDDLKKQNRKLKVRLNDLGVEYYE